VLAEVALRLLSVRALPVKAHPVMPDKTPNPMGLRDPLERAFAVPGAVKIAFLGDSFTFGLGVGPDQTFSRQVERLLAKHYSRRCVTINLGRDGADLIAEWAIYNRVRDLILPDVVVHVISQNDLDFDLYRSFDPIARLATGRLPLSRYSRVLELAETKIRSGIASDRSVVYMQGGATPAERDRVWRIASFEIKAAKQLVEAGGGVYALVRFPWLRKVGAPDDYPLADVNRRTADLARQLGVPYLGLLEAFRGRDPDDLCLLPYDDHPSPKAHGIAAEAICAFLVREVLPKVRPAASSRPAVKRTPQHISEAEIRHYRQVLQIDPNCFSARFHLDRASTSQKTQ
jgi:lysophospholipase L1-like esterase